jgi:hypothetical protein
MPPMKNWFERLWSEERRDAERHTSLPLAAYYWDGAAPTPRQVRDISPTGMFLLTEQRWYPNTMITMTLIRNDMPETDPDRSIKIAARVVRSGTDGVGLSFVVPPARSRSSDGPFAYVADRKGVTQFLARLHADMGGNPLKSATLMAASLIAVLSLASIEGWMFRRTPTPAIGFEYVHAGVTTAG